MSQATPSFRQGNNCSPVSFLENNLRRGFVVRNDRIRFKKKFKSMFSELGGSPSLLRDCLNNNRVEEDDEEFSIDLEKVIDEYCRYSMEEEE